MLLSVEPRWALTAVAKHRGRGGFPNAAADFILSANIDVLTEAASAGVERNEMPLEPPAGTLTYAVPPGSHRNTPTDQPCMKSGEVVLSEVLIAFVSVVSS